MNTDKAIYEIDCLIVGVLLALLILFSPTLTLINTRSHYLTVMDNINKIDTKNNLRERFDKDLDYTELLNWEKERLIYDNGRIERNEDPLKILEYGRGRCGEFTILYVALCLAHGYQTRLVVDVFGDHTWAEVFDEGAWIHVDTEGRINEPYMYERDWKKTVRLVYAFEENKIIDVTWKYNVILKNR